jgi:hypothetical protein
MRTADQRQHTEKMEILRKFVKDKKSKADVGIVLPGSRSSSGSRIMTIGLMDVAPAGTSSRASLKKKPGNTSRASRWMTPRGKR